VAKEAGSGGRINTKTTKLKSEEPEQRKEEDLLINYLRRKSKRK